MPAISISTHVLDTARGRPASGIGVVLEQNDGRGAWRVIGRGETDVDGRVRSMTKDAPVGQASYRLTFDTRRYFEANNVPVFYPSVTVTFEAAAGEPHYHVPLLLSPFGYSTYRGS